MVVYDQFDRLGFEAAVAEFLKDCGQALVLSLEHGIALRGSRGDIGKSLLIAGNVLTPKIVALRFSCRHRTASFPLLAGARNSRSLGYLRIRIITEQSAARDVEHHGRR